MIAGTRIHITDLVHAVAVALVVAACSGAPEPRAPTRVDGTVTYRERMALPPDAEVRVQLLDVSRQDVAAEEIASQTVRVGEQQVPIRFNLAFEPSSIDPRHSYSVRAEIVIGGKRLFGSTRHYPVITNGNPTTVDVVVERMDGKPGEGPRYIVGMFSYMADAGLFTECGRSNRVPVAQEGDNAALERAYSTAHIDPGEAVLVTLQGRYADRPKMEGTGTRRMLVVEQFGHVWPGELCERADVRTPLIDTFWRLFEVNGKPFVLPEGQERESHIQLRSRENRVRGFGGCNGFSGGYEIDGGKLTFTDLAATVMACPQMDAERVYLNALGQVSGYEILGESLVLTAGDGRILARFRAAYFR